MDKSKKFRMPAGIRNKLTAAIAMLLVSSIMMVSSTYAWFTLSTAPEVTGITTSVGANGNLEMALLNTETYADLGKIASAVGNSSAVQAVTNANITWGNLVDLSDAGYGLQNISLQPARLNFKSNTTEGTDPTTTYVGTALNSATSLLLMPVYGKDGRVAELSDKTYSTIYTNNSWAFDTNSQQYGVRAIGANDNLTPQQAGLIAAKAAYNRNLSSAKSAVQGALSTYGNDLASALTALAIDSAAKLSEAQQTAVQKLIEASSSALNYIDAAYKQALLAYTASLVEDATIYANAVQKINQAADFAAALNELQTLAGENSLTLNVPTALTGAVTALTTQKGEVAAAQNLYNGVGTENSAPDYTGALAKLVDSTKITINGFEATEIKTESGINGDFTSAIINDGGAIVEMPDDSGVFAYVGSVAGNYSANCKVDIHYGESVNMTGINATMKTTATVDTVVPTALNALQAAASTSGATVLSDTFGYALDFAFRTNAAESYLLLQTAAAQRVYSDSESAATQGAGASMTFQVTTTDAGVATLTNEQVENLMKSIRVAFINPGTNEVYGIAALSNIAEGADGFKGDLYLHNYTVDANSGVMTLGEKKTVGPADGVDPAAIMKLDQSVAARLTVVVWLDGDMVDNADVANAAQSLIGAMNLQFSSSAELIPMQNTALQNMTITYTELTDNNYKVGLYNYNGADNVLKTGYKLYQGSDNTVYFSNDETNYTKLTIMNYTTAMTPLSVSVTGVGTVEVNGTTELILTASATPKTVEWSSSSANATVTGDTSKATVSGATVGAAEITATVNFEFTGTGVDPVTKTVTVKFPVTVTEAAPVTPEEPDGGDDEGTDEPTQPTGAYTVTIGETGHVTADKTTANQGDTVTLTVETGYVVTVTGDSGAVATEGNGTTTVTFVMPAENVIVVANVDGGSGN